MQTIDDLFAKFGGVREFAAITDIKYSTAVAFKTRNSIPMEYWKTIEARAKAKKIEGVTRYTLTDLLIARYPDVPVRRQTRRAERTTP